MTRGDTPTIRVNTFDADGVAADLSGTDITFTAALTPQSESLFEKLDGAGITVFPGYLLILIDADDTEDLSNSYPTTLIWDITVDDGVAIETIADGTLLVKPSVG